MSSGNRKDVNPKSGIRGWFKDLSRTRKVATVIVTVAGGIVTVATAISLMFQALTWFVPSIKPPPSSVEGGATLSNLEVVRNVTLEEYIRWPGMPAEVRLSEVSEERRQRLGSIIRFDIELKGFAGERVDLKWSVFDADTGKPVGGLTEQPAWPSNYVIPEHDVSIGQRETWVPFPLNGKGTFLVILEAYATLGESEVRLDSEDVKVSTQE